MINMQYKYKKCIDISDYYLKIIRDSFFKYEKFSSNNFVIYYAVYISWKIIKILNCSIYKMLA